MAVAAFVVAGVLGFAGDSRNAIWILVAGAAVVGGYLAATRRSRGPLAVSLAVGIALNVGALFLAFLLLLVAGGCDGGGHVPLGAWIVGAGVYLAGAAWAIQRARRTWWGLPLATLVAAAVLVGLSVLLTGSTGVCLS